MATPELAFIRPHLYRIWLISVLLLVQHITQSLAGVPTVPTQRHAEVVRCLESKSIKKIARQDPRYLDFASTFNLRLQYKPAVIALAETSRHVQDAVLCARRHGLKVQARSGGHSYGSHSMGGADGSLIVDLQRFQAVTYDKKTQIATFGPGIRLGNLALALQKYGRAVPHGTCSNVGAGGHFTVGGNGFTTRAHGLAIDSLVAIDVVLADGRLVHATSKDYTAVFFAMRGVGPSFGIATNFYAKTFPIPTVTGIYLAWPGLVTTDVEAGISILKHVQNFVNNKTSGFDRNFQFDVTLDCYGIFNLKGEYLGTVEKFNKTVMPELLRGLPTPGPGDDDSPTFIRQYSWSEALVDASYGNQLRYPKPGEPDFAPTPDADNFYIKSLNVPPPGLSEKAMRNLITWARDHQIEREPATPWYFSLLLQGGPDNQIYLESKQDEAAFWRKDLTWIVESSGFVEPANATYPVPEGIDMVDELYEQATAGLPPGPRGAFQGCPDTEWNVQKAGLLYYGDKLFSKLKDLKRKLDPEDIFHHPQSIPLH